MSEPTKVCVACVPVDEAHSDKLEEANERACALLDAVLLNLQRGALALPQDKNRLYRASGLLRLARLSSSPLPPKEEDFGGGDAPSIETVESVRAQLAEAQRTLFEAQQALIREGMARNASEAARKHLRGALDTALGRLREVDEAFADGFVRCESCGGQEDTADLDMRSDVKEVAEGLAAALTASPGAQRLDARMVEFNINNHVRVRLTDVGRAVFADHWRPFCDPAEALKERDGWAEFQLWELAHVFGGSLGNGMPLPFETTIRFEDPRAATPAQDRQPFDEELNQWAHGTVDQIVRYKFTGDLSDQPWGLLVDAVLEARRTGRREGQRQNQRRERATGVTLIADERKRQIEQEGWTPDHDAEHEGGELARAAACYASPHYSYPSAKVPDGWPWAPKWWKPSQGNRLRDLVKAGALIAAEIDRLAPPPAAAPDALATLLSSTPRAPSLDHLDFDATSAIPAAAPEPAAQEVVGDDMMGCQTCGVPIAPAPTPCGDALTVRSVPPMDLVCVLPAGHEGEHQSAGDSTWTDATHPAAPTPATKGEPTSDQPRAAPLVVTTKGTSDAR